MRSQFFSIVAFVLALIALVITLQQKLTFATRLDAIESLRERNYSRKLVANLNIVREAMGKPPVNPANFGDLIAAYLETTSDILDSQSSLDSEKKKVINGTVTTNAPSSKPN